MPPRATSCPKELANEGVCCCHYQSEILYAAYFYIWSAPIFIRLSLGDGISFLLHPAGLGLLQIFPGAFPKRDLVQACWLTETLWCLQVLQSKLRTVAVGLFKKHYCLLFVDAKFQLFW